MHSIAESNVATLILKELKEMMGLNSNVKVPAFPVRILVCLSSKLFFKIMNYISDTPCRSIHAPLHFHTIDTSIGKVYYHFAENRMKFDDAKDYCAKMGFNVNLPMPKEYSKISQLHLEKKNRESKYLSVC